MSSYKNFQTSNQKHTKNRSNHNPEHNPSVISSHKKLSKFQENIKKHVEAASFLRHYPDVFLELITPEDGKAKLSLDQKVILRAACRELAIYGVFARGFGKTFIEMIAAVLTCIFYPNSDIALVAQTKENAANIAGAKYEEIMRFWPLLKNEVVDSKITSKRFDVEFANGSKLNILANAQSSKGNRRTGINQEESAQGKPELFADVIEPIVSEARKISWKHLVTDPTEPCNHRISFYTTSWYRNHPEFERVRQFTKDWVDLNGKMYLSADWKLHCYYQRGQPIDKMKEIKKNTDPITFAFNYGSEWIGSHSGALVDTTQLEALRVVDEAENKGDGESEYFIGVDVARSRDAKNASTVAVVCKIKRRSDNRISQIKLVNIYIIDSALSMQKQSVEIKKIKNRFDASMVIVDANGLGVGLVDALMDDSFDENGDDLGCWNTINTDHEPSNEISEQCLYAFMPQTYNNDAIVNFMGLVKASKVQLLRKKNNIDSLNDLPHVQTDFLISEVDNLELKRTNAIGGKVTVERIKKSIPKDKYSALIYVLWYIMTYEDVAITNNTNYKSYVNALSY